MADFYGVLVEEDVLRGGLDRTGADYSGRLYRDCLEFRAPTPLPAFRVVFVIPVASNLFRAYLSDEPKHISSLALDDVLMADNWSIGLVSGPGSVPVVEKIENVQPQPGTYGPVLLDVDGTTLIYGSIPTAWSVDIRTASPLFEKASYTVVASTSIVSASEGLGMDSTYDRWTNSGPVVVKSNLEILKRPVSTRTGIDFNYDFFQKRLRLDSKNDIDVHSGLEALWKRIVRRLISSRGGFFHLSFYGTGLKVKQPLRVTELTKLQGDIEEQVWQEDEVTEVEVSVQKPAQGVLLVILRIDSNLGTISKTLEVPQEGEFVVS
jgi:hypothetical protein